MSESLPGHKVQLLLDGKPVAFRDCVVLDDPVPEKEPDRERQSLHLQGLAVDLVLLHGSEGYAQMFREQFAALMQKADESKRLVILQPRFHSGTDMCKMLREAATQREVRFRQFRLAWKQGRQLARLQRLLKKRKRAKFWRPR